MTTCPDVKTAVFLWQESVAEIAEWINQRYLRDYIFHSTGVATAAAKIAARSGLDEEKAYALGLLHDYGKKQNQKETGISHIMAGYDKMMAEGWSDVARVCLSHSFPDSDFDLSDYIFYPPEDMRRAQALLKQIKYDDYDRLIQLCDVLFEATSIVSYQRRFACIRQRYRLTEKQTAAQENKAAENKAYFDAKCGCDIYKLLNIEE